MDSYKPYSEMTNSERQHKKWLESGRPRIVWDTKRRGTYTPNLDPEHARIFEENSKPFRAVNIGLPTLQLHKRKKLRELK
jgi:hypothetical protein